MKKTLTPEMIARIAEEGKDGRLLFVNTTNLDDASPHIFYLVPEAQRAVATGDIERFIDPALIDQNIEPGIHRHELARFAPRDSRQ